MDTKYPRKVSSWIHSIQEKPEDIVESWTALYMYPQESEYCPTDCSIVDLLGLGR